METRKLVLPAAVAELARMLLAVVVIALQRSLHELPRGGVRMGGYIPTTTTLN
jgi:hypothetical protein